MVVNCTMKSRISTCFEEAVDMMHTELRNSQAKETLKSRLLSIDDRRFYLKQDLELSCEKIDRQTEEICEKARKCGEEKKDELKMRAAESEKWLNVQQGILDDLLSGLNNCLLRTTEFLQDQTPLEEKIQELHQIRSKLRDPLELVIPTTGLLEFNSGKIRTREIQSLLGDLSCEEGFVCRFDKSKVEKEWCASPKYKIKGFSRGIRARRGRGALEVQFLQGPINNRSIKLCMTHYTVTLCNTVDDSLTVVKKKVGYGYNDSLRVITWDELSEVKGFVDDKGMIKIKVTIDRVELKH